MLRLRLLGGLSVESDGAPVGGSANQPRRLALLAVIARAGAAGVTREHLQALLWPDLDDQRVRKVLTHAIYSLRRDLGDEDAITGVKDLRLNVERVVCDLAEFERSMSAGDLERAAEAYTGPFLHGFRVPGAPEFDRWADAERSVLAHRHAELLETLGREARRRNDAPAAVHWWRRAAAQDPLNARVTIELMEALVAAGNVAGALQQARIYEALVDEELSIPPDREVVRLAEQIRRDASRDAHPGVASSEAPPAVPIRPVTAPAPAAPLPAAPDRSTREAPAVAEAAEEAEAAVTPTNPPSAPAVVWPGRAPVLVRPNPPWRGRFVAGAAILAVTALGITTVRLWRSRPAPGAGGAVPVLVVGPIRDHRDTSASEGLGTTADLLATSLARAIGLTVVSTARVYELLAQTNASLQHPTLAHVSAAARRAGATELIDGDIYPLPDDRLRLDIRRTRLPAGDLAGSLTLIGDELFALVDSGTALLVRDAGARLPAGAISDVTTASEMAYQFYEEGLRHYFDGDRARARTFFESAVETDSAFAMATFYLALATRELESGRRSALLERARELAVGAGDRERLVIRAGYGFYMRDPSLLAVAETLAVRYPLEIEGHLYSGLALQATGQPAAAIGPLRRVLALDSSGFEQPGRRCPACEAMSALIHAYVAIDSLPAAVREAERWVRRQPESARAWRDYGSTLLAAGRAAEAADAFRQVGRIEPSQVDDPGLTAALWIRQDRADTAEALLRRLGTGGEPVRRFALAWYLTIALREQGKLTSALATVVEARRIRRRPPEDTLIGEGLLLHAQVLLEMGRARDAAALMDSLARRFAHVPATSAWALAHRASALFAAGDTLPLVALADTLERVGRQTLNRRYLHDYARGLVHDARGELGAAAVALREATRSGLARANLRYASVLLRLGRPAEAVPTLRALLRGDIEAGNLYTTRTEVHELLAQAWDAAGQPDSAAAHWRVVAESWRAADRPLHRRRDAARRRLTSRGAAPEPRPVP